MFVSVETAKKKYFGFKGSWLNFTSDVGDQSVGVRVVDRRVSAVNEVYRLCLSVWASPGDSETRATVVDGSGCIDVTIINNNSQ